MNSISFKTEMLRSLLGYSIFHVMGPIELYTEKGKRIVPTASSMSFELNDVDLPFTIQITCENDMIIQIIKL